MEIPDLAKYQRIFFDITVNSSENSVSGTHSAINSNTSYFFIGIALVCEDRAVA